MKRTRLAALFCAALLLALCASAGAEPWKLSLESNLTTALNTYSNNWVGTEQGAFSWAGRATGIAERQLTPRLNTLTTLKLAFGQSALQKEDSVTGKRSWSPLEKSTDQIDLESILKFNISGFVEPYVAVQALTQFYEEKYGMLRYGNPADIKESFGVAKEAAKTERLAFNLRLGGAINEHVDRYLPDTAQVATNCGLDFVAEFKVDRVRDVITYLSRLNIFEAVYKFDAPDGYTLYRHPDVKWENTLTISLTKYIMLSYIAELQYDAEITLGARFRQVFGAGFTVQLPERPAEAKK